ncbi:MAG: dephospho-CoA kinase [Tannerellaceae bacterium]|nr:dephospho-CoA kinase [Tannerellaceae bacterium]
MIKIGLTGGIGSGKSVVAKLFQIIGIPVYIADRESKKLTESSPLIKNQLTRLLGDKLYQGGKLNKPLLAQYIFNNSNYLAAVNRIIHPVVLEDFLIWAKEQTTHIVVIESAILFESGFNQKTDKSLMVYAPEEIRINRVSERDHLSREEVKSRIQNQLPDKKKCELADFIITNSGKEALIPQIETFLTTL